MKISKFIFTLGALFLLFASCTQDEALMADKVPAGQIKLNISAAGLGQHIVTTRATTKDPEETEIHNLHIFFFDNQSGEYLTSSSTASEEGKSYRYLTGGVNTLLIDGGQFVNPDNVDIYVLANLEEGTFRENADGKPVTADGTVIENRAALLNYNYTPYGKDDFTTRLPNTGLPMYGNMQADFTISGGQVIDVEMKSLMARIDFNITMNPADVDVSRGYPQLRITRIDMCNMPGGARIQGYANGEETAIMGNCTSGADVTIPLTDGQSTSLTFYMFEHLRHTNGQTIDPSVKDEYKQRYKPNLAKADAAYVLLTGRYIDKNAHPYDVTYKLYLGANHTDDFNILRNCKYVNNISVKGITAVNHPDNPDETIGLDVRVTVSRDQNEYYIAILREREHDAHFNVTPMDVYVPGAGSVSVEIPDADGANTWIRLDPIRREATSEGDGKRNYFETDMLTRTLNGTENKSYTVQGKSTGMTVERIYLFIDENASTRERSVPIKVYHTPEGESKSDAPTQELDIRQVGLLKAVINDGGTMKTVYMETYEEYLDYYDPLSPFNSEHLYDGLAWGVSGTEIGNEDGGTWGLGTDCSQNFTMGVNFTPTIARKAEQAHMTLNELPLSAAAYCYNKNKRNSSGDVVRTEWYLPGIREIEQALLPYYNDFPEFQDNFYWSSAAGEERGHILGLNEDSNRARATKIRYYPGGASNPNAPNNVNWSDGGEGEYCYIKSGVGDEGWLPRTTVCRIRCMRITEGVTE